MARTYSGFDTARPTIVSATRFLTRQLFWIAPKMDAALGAMAQAAEASGVENAYHNPRHTLEVLGNAAALIQIDESLAATRGRHTRILSEREIAIVLSAALGHDLGHDGGTNRTADGTRLPFRLEHMAVARTDAILAAANISKTMRADVATLIYATDVGEPNGTRAITKGLAQGTLDPATVPPELRPLATRPSRLEMARILCDADLLSSAGLAASLLKQHNRALAAEWGKPVSPQDTLAFLDHIAGPSFQSRAGQFFNPNLAAIRAEMAAAVKMPLARAGVVIERRP
jgi:hypothetical protein